MAQQYGAEVVWRPAEISGDTASSESALLHTLEHLRQSEAYEPDVLVFLQCTSPLTLAEDIDGTVQALLDQGADSALATIPFHYFLWRQADGDAVGINHDKRSRPLRQERQPQYLESGAVYAMRADGFLGARHRFFGKTALYVMPAERRLEIDDPVDFQVAEVLVRQQGRLARSTRLPETVAALILDFDGVFSDDKVYVFQDGREAVRCDRMDGMGIGLLKVAGLPIWVLSTEPNPVVRARADKLGIPVPYLETGCRVVRALEACRRSLSGATGRSEALVGLARAYLKSSDAAPAAPQDPPASSGGSTSRGRASGHVAATYPADTLQTAFTSATLPRGGKIFVMFSSVRYITGFSNDYSP